MTFSVLLAAPAVRGLVEDTVSKAQRFEEAGRVPVLAWMDGVEFDLGTLQQLRDAASLPIVGPHVAAMPDAHPGKGSTIGSVIPTKGAIVPSAVGVDIGCGMVAVETQLVASGLPDTLAGVRSAIEKAVPHGNGPGGNWRDGRWPREAESHYAPLAPDLAALRDADDELQRATEGGNEPLSQLGTLGGGNHFIEVCLDERDHVWLMLHSGSRGIGNRIGTHFIARARRRAELDGITLPQRDLAWLPEGTPEFESYVRAVRWCQDYAHRNRDVMLGQVMRAMSHALSRDVVAIDAAINCHHNYVEQETHFGEQLWITRKGAVAAFPGRLGIIPGSMGAKSFIVEGLGNPESFMSCSHGAGRRLSRTRAKETISLDEHAAATRHVECRKDQGVLDETPGAYKSIDAVMAAQADLVKPLHTLRQVVCVKG